MVIYRKENIILVGDCKQGGVFILMTSQKEIGEKIRKERKCRNLSMENLAIMTGISYNTLGRIEGGEYFAPMETYYRIGDILGT